jgi:succinate dehydrogenase / fumarate reductase cytochrome b subunit
MSSAAAKKARPKYLSLSALLFEIRLPPSAWVSGFHRISGFLLFLPFTAWLLYLLDASLASEQGFAHVRDEYLRGPIARLAILVFVWAFAHHLFAGIRFLLIDMNKGVDLPQARYSSYAVFVISVLVTLFVGWRLWS